jgi:SET domain-containing protein
MILIKNYVASSKIHGVGLFVAEPVKKGDLVWVYDERVDHKFDEKAYQSLPDAFKEYMKTYGYIEKADGCYYMAADNGKFINHSDSPNVYYSQCGMKGYAATDMSVGDEIVIDYSEFDAEWNDIKDSYEVKKACS